MHWVQTESGARRDVGAATDAQRRSRSAWPRPSGRSWRSSRPSS